MDNILIGAVYGPGQLGLYDRSYRLMMFPMSNVNQPMRRVFLPLLGKCQDEHERYRTIFLSALRITTLASLPPIGIAVAASDSLVPLLLGDQWAAAAPIFFWLSLAAAFQPINNTIGMLFVGSNRPSLLLRYGMVSSFTLVLAFLIGVQFGAAGVAQAYFWTMLCMSPLLLYLGIKGDPLDALAIVAATAPAILGAVASGMSLILIEKW